MELVVEVEEDVGRDDDEDPAGPPVRRRRREVGLEEGDGGQRLAQAHDVREDAAAGLVDVVVADLLVPGMTRF